MRPPKVTVIVPVYNAARWLPASFRSFERQTYANTEWVLVDDGSADSSAELCSSWCGRDPAHRRLVRKENGGASSARNVGLDVAVGDYVLFWDSDDEQDPTAIEKMVEGIPGPGGVVVSSIRRVLPDGSHRDLFSCERHTMKPEGAVAAWLQGGVSSGPYSKLSPRAMLVENGIRFEEGVINEDVMWTAEVLAAASSVTFIGEPLYHYVAREGSVTGSFDSRFSIVFDNCRKLEEFVRGRFPGLEESCAAYCANACWSVIVAASRGGNKRNYPDVYARAMNELSTRGKAIAKYCATPKDRALRLLVKSRVYGVLKK